jgi:beta-barrel assembly-enhancing protease
LLKAADNEAQLASVVAQEIDHIASWDMVEQMRQTAIVHDIPTAASLDRTTAVQVGVELTLRPPNKLEIL